MHCRSCNYTPIISPPPRPHSHLSHAHSKQLEPDYPPLGKSSSSSNVLTDLLTPIPSSASSFRRNLFQKLGVKGWDVNDSSPLSPTHAPAPQTTLTPSTLTPSNLTTSISVTDLTTIDNTDSDKLHRCLSQSYQGSSPCEETVHVVRVALENDSSCMYKCLLVSGQLSTFVMSIRSHHDDMANIVPCMCVGMY